MNQSVCHAGGRMPFAAKGLLALALLAGAAGVAQAQQTSNWRFYAGGGMASGGEVLASGTIVNVQNGNTIPFKIKPAGDLQFRIGADYRLNERFSVQAAIGHGNSDPMGTNGSLSMTTIPWEFTGFFNITDALRIGGGYRRSYADLSATGVGLGWQGLGRYNSNNGAVLEVQYLWSNSGPTNAAKTQFGLSLRAVSETFSQGGNSFSGNHYEVGVALYY